MTRIRLQHTASAPTAHWGPAQPQDTMHRPVRSKDQEEARIRLFQMQLASSMDHAVPCSMHHGRFCWAARRCDTGSGRVPRPTNRFKA